MNIQTTSILIIGGKDKGKSILGDKIRNAIVRIDNEASVTVFDEDRNQKTLGSGFHKYNIFVKREDSNQKGYDIVITINTDKFKDLTKEL